MGTTSGESFGDLASGAPRAARAISALVAVEALALLAVAVFLVVELVVAEAAEPLGAVTMAVLALLMAVGLGACARSLLMGQRWARAPVLTWQLLQASLALPMIRSDLRLLGLALLALCVVVGIGVVRLPEAGVRPPR